MVECTALEMRHRCKPIGGSNPSLSATFRTGSVPETWVTFHSEDIGNTFGPKEFARGSSLQVSSSKYPRS